MTRFAIEGQSVHMCGSYDGYKTVLNASDFEPALRDDVHSVDILIDQRYQFRLYDPLQH